MKFLIVYSSRTGNTRQVAEALYAAAPDGSTISKVETAPAADGYDVIFVGYWMDRGTADEKSKAYLRTQKGAGQCPLLLSCHAYFFSCLPNHFSKILS